MELGLKNKVAFVAASSQGLGKRVALELAQEGASTII
jgi:3-oxoacyl-[acyl-carrier protein] reductase